MTSQPHRPGSPTPEVAADNDVELFDVMSRTAYAQEITEALIEATPDVTAAQIIQIRQQLTASACRRGWLDD